MSEENWPRIRDLPQEEQAGFRKWLYGQTVPIIPAIPMEEQDGYYPWDYETWKNKQPITD